MKELLYINPNSISNELCDKIIKTFEIDKNVNRYSALAVHADVKTEEWCNIKNEIVENIESNIKIYNSTINYKNAYEYAINKKFSLKLFIINKFYQNDKTMGDPYSINKHKSDFNICGSKQTVLTFIYFLNDVSEGGELEFYNFHKINAEKGKMVIFPTDWFFANKHTVAISSDSYVIKGQIYIDI
jgi:hypothetical protein